MLLYSSGIFFYQLAISIARFFNPKAALLYTGRKNTPKILADFTRDSTRPLAWFHCASLGEFEQARPVIERLKQERDIQIAVSFFSPSGYEIRKNYELADVVFYLPSDSRANAQMVLDQLKPSVVFFIKYEIWVHYIQETAKRGIPLYLLSATFRDSHIYFKNYGRYLKRALQRFDVIFTQDSDSADLLKRNNISNVAISNDTRYDRVYNTCNAPGSLPVIQAFKGSHKLLIAGSSYLEEEKQIAGILSAFPGLKVIVAPHHIQPEHISQIEELFHAVKTVRYSQAQPEDVVNAQVLIIDNIGLLARAYQYADLAVIGGGFGTKGLHNMLEAATFGMPIFTGPNNHKRFPETHLLKEAGVLYTIHHQTELQSILERFLTDETLLTRTRETSRELIRKNTGATDVIINHINILAS